MRLAAASLLSSVAAALVASACGPSIDPAAKADIDRRVSVLQAGANTVPAPAPGMFAPMPFAVGQWAQYKMTNDKNEPSFLTCKIVGQDGDAIWLEMVNGTFEGCFKARTDAQWGPWRSVADSWAHPVVPLSGTVRSQGVDHPFAMELTAFGVSGAVGEL